MQPVIGPAGGGLVHVMTFNLRYPARDPGHLWEQRRPLTAALLRLERPTVLGTQEGYHGQVRDVAADLPDGYEWVGLGREGGSRGEFAAVFYDAGRLRPLEYDHFWLSDTPRGVGSVSWGNTIPRMATWVRFADPASRAELVVLNTHLDHASAPARERGAELLAETVASFDPLPVVVTGDFNAPAGAGPVYTRMTAKAGLVDTWAAAHRQLTPEFETCPGYREPAVGGDRIDWVLATPAITAEAAAINPFGGNGRYPSDHLPVQALLRLPA